MPEVPSNHNTPIHTISNPSIDSTQNTRRKGGGLNSLLPRAIHRTAQNMGQYAENMQAPTDTQYMGGVSGTNDSLSKKALMHQLALWQAAAPITRFRSFLNFKVESVRLLP